jgi:hypothetical protein
MRDAPSRAKGDEMFKSFDELTRFGEGAREVLVSQVDCALGGCGRNSGFVDSDVSVFFSSRRVKAATADLH